MIFLKTEYEKTKTRVRPVSGQKLVSGEPIYNTWAVKCDKEIRNRYEIGTVFVVEDLEKTGINYYTAKGLMLALNENAPAHEKAPEEAFRQYAKHIGDKTLQKATSTRVETTAPRVTHMDKLRRNIKYAVPTVEDTGFYIDPDLWYLSIRNIKQQLNTMYLGPTGIGKTTLVKLIAEKTELSFTDHDMGSMLDPISGLLGTHRLSEKGSIFDYADFTKDITREGIILLDELSRAPASANNILFPTLDFRRYLPVAIAEAGNRRIPLHEKCSMVATANEGGKYTGTTPMDAALKSRFFLVELDYLEPTCEVSILKKKSCVSEAEAIKIVSTANNIRSLYKKGDVSDAPGTRETLMAADMVRDGYTALKAIEYVFLPMFEGSKAESGSERNTVTKIIVSK